ncbi:MAG: PilZ domain-containing protein [Lachnospiraceae bacterium]|nr:PilZ domain-containing protein [Lachnospiraceae bacterium]
MVGTETNGIYIPTLSIGGNTIDFSAKEFSGIVFNLYCTDKRYGNRYCWRSVSLSVRKWQGTDYYLVTSAGFGKIGTESDRRVDDRILLNLSGEITRRDAEEAVYGTILNISNTGMAFHAIDSAINIGTQVKIQFQDEVGEHKFKLAIDTKCIRKQPMDDGFFYGCGVVDVNKEWLTYVFLKKLWQKVPTAQ